MNCRKIQDLLIQQACFDRFAQRVEIKHDAGKPTVIQTPSGKKVFVDYDPLIDHKLDADIDAQKNFAKVCANSLHHVVMSEEDHAYYRSLPRLIAQEVTKL